LNSKKPLGVMFYAATKNILTIDAATQKYFTTDERPPICMG
jgi:hypothetical protein